MSSKWDQRFIDVAKMVASWSKDPSTKVGAIIVDNGRHPVSVGYNGLPASMVDDPAILNDREQKYKYVVHAERNAILNSPCDVKGCTIYVTHPCCSGCVEFIIERGISRVVFEETSDVRFTKSWNSELAVEKLRTANIDVTILKQNPTEEN